MSRPARRHGAAGRAWRRLLAAMLPWCAAWSAAAGDGPAVVPERPVVLPADHGSHPDYRTEWWYVTGWLETGRGETLGFQVTFFRTRQDLGADNPSAFTPRQLIIAHAALSDPALGRLRHDQRIARATHGLAGADTVHTRVWLGDWRLQRDGEQYRTQVTADGFSLELVLEATQPAMVNGLEGYSQKGPRPESASYYYSVPQLRVSGSILRDGRRDAVTGTAWLDHEWSTALLDPAARGWDWIGINLDDGSALMAFRMRDRDGGPLWAGGTLRRPGGGTTTFGPEQIVFTPARRWRSPRTGIDYPVGWRVRAGALELDLEPLFDDQESDSRPTTGAVYWEGAVRATRGGAGLGRGYLELTGYGEPLRLPGAGGP